MKHSFYILLAALLFTGFSFAQDIWINEFSYNCNGDVDEFVEIVAPVGTDMSSYGIVFYHNNGNYTANYYTQLSGVISATNADNGKGFLVVLTNNSSYLVAESVISLGVVTQSVSPELGMTNFSGGVLLVNHSTGELVHGICYEMVPTEMAPEVVENKLEIEDVSWNHEPFTVGVGKIDPITNLMSDNGDSAPGGSISMVGDAFSRNWRKTDGVIRGTQSTPGRMNSGQGSLPVELASFTASVVSNGVLLNWRTETEVNNAGFNIERKSETGTWKTIDFVQGNGNTNTPVEYSYIDKNISIGKYLFRLKQIDNGGQFEYSNVIEVFVNTLAEYELNQNYPNPFNPTTSIKFSLPEAGNVKLAVYNLLGQKVKSLVNEFKEAGNHTVNFNAQDLSSGVYIYKIETNNFTQTRKMTLLK